MNCPVCQKEMIEQDFGGTKVDVCKNGCKGIWFDWFEINKVDERYEAISNALNEALKHPRASDKDRGKVKCPKCDMPMLLHKYQHSKDVNVDECPNCSGFFLDSGELSVIQSTFMTQQQRQEFADKLFEDIKKGKR